ncbi:uncharacterized protein LOC122807003 [Protopterus annectens]|uniref:uncharacterized protein LOC122807003 n=1 Tax=Protopterus annectens TaxID=7888 RepID=UPI001CF93617|nr:uncharacterized protein LOC122807003 [Protopterus annectens]
MGLILTLVCWCLLHSIYISALEGQSFLIKNAHLEKCVHASHKKNRVSLVECNPYSPYQQWSWDFNSDSIVSMKSRECLLVHKPAEFSHVKLGSCENNSNSAWSCTKKGLLVLQGLGLYLNARQGTNSVFVSREKNKLSKWKTMENKTVCPSDGDNHKWQHNVVKEDGNPKPVHLIAETFVTSASEVKPSTTKSIARIIPSIFTDELNNTDLQAVDKRIIEDGITWKMTMLVLSTVVLFLGLVILLINVHYNRKKKKFSALKAYPQVNDCTRADETPDEQTLLVNPSGHSPQNIQGSRSPSLRHGEIIIEWKDGTITSLYDSTDGLAG